MLDLTQHAQVRMNQRGVPYEFVVLLYLFAEPAHCRDGYSFSLTREQYQQIVELFFKCAPERVPAETV